MTDDSGNGDDRIEHTESNETVVPSDEDGAFASPGTDREVVEIDPSAIDPDEEGPCAYTEYVRGTPVEDLPATGEGATGVEADVWEALYGVEDPEMPVSIVDLGLIYGVDVEESDGETVAAVVMTLTYTGCPARDMLTDEVRETVRAVDGIDDVSFELVWNPPWTLEMVTEAGKADLREFGLSV